MPENKEFKYTFRNTPGDYFRFRFGNTYHHWTAVVNIVFTAAVGALIVSRWQSVGVLGHVLMILGLMLFPVFQPLALYGSSVKDSEKIKVDTTICFDKTGMHITVKDHHQTIAWRDYREMVYRKSMLIAVPDGIHAYILSNRILGGEKEDLYKYVTENINAYSSGK